MDGSRLTSKTLSYSVHLFLLTSIYSGTYSLVHIRFQEATRSYISSRDHHTDLQTRNQSNTTIEPVKRWLPRNPHLLGRPSIRIRYCFVLIHRPISPGSPNGPIDRHFESAYPKKSANWPDLCRSRSRWMDSLFISIVHSPGLLLQI